MSPVDDKARRAAARASWPGLKTTLADAPGAEDLSATTTVVERVAMVDALTRTAWALSGKPLPDYTRADMPGRLTRLGEP